MTSRRVALLLSTILAVAAAFAIGQSGASSAPSGTLMKCQGQGCTVYLRVESDPRAGRNSSSGGGSPTAGIVQWEGIPISVAGTLTTVSPDSIVVSSVNGQVWVPLSQVRAIEFAPAPTITPPPASHPHS